MNSAFHSPATSGASHSGDWQATLDAIPTRLAVLNDRAEVVAVNEAWRTSAVASGGATSLGVNYLALCEAATADADVPLEETEGARGVADAIRAALAGSVETFAVEYPCPSPTAERWFSARVSGFYAANGLRIMVMHEDVTGRRIAERHGRDQAALLNAVDAALVATDLDGVVTQWSGGAERMYGWTAGEAVGQPITALELTPADHSLGLDIQASMHQTGTWEGEYDVRRKDQGVFPAHVRSGLFLDDEGVPRGYMGVSVDISRRVELERELRRTNVFLDEVTARMADGLYVVDDQGMLRFMNEAAEQILGWREEDLQERPVNLVIEAIGEDGIAYPPERFPFTRDDVPRQEGVRIDSDVLTHRSGGLVPVSYSSVPFETSYGEHGRVIVFSDIAARKAEERKLQDDHRALEWVSRIRDALRERRMVLYAQPIVSLATGQTVQHELLIRMLSEEGELVPPGDFLPIAEEYGLIREIDRYVIREAMAFAGVGHNVELNLSADSLSDPSLLHYVKGELEAYDVEPARVVFEITETAMMDDEENAQEFVRGVAALGCAVALDDFGTGYGGFHYLKHLPVKYLKIDREFVTDLHQDSADRHVVEAIVRLAKGMGLLTVGEGVEDPATLGILSELGVDQVQGWALGRPAPIREVFPARG